MTSETDEFDVVVALRERLAVARKQGFTPATVPVWVLARALEEIEAARLQEGNHGSE